MNITDYIAIAGIFGALIFATLYYSERNYRLQAQADLAVSVHVNKDNEVYLDQMRQFKTQTEQALKQYEESLNVIVQGLNEVNESTKKVLATNEEFRKWFNSAIPDDAVRLYNKAKRDSRPSSDNK